MKTITANSANVSRMAKKRTGGEHVTPRKTMQMPMDWYKLAFRLASEGRQPILWYFMSKMAEDADKKGIERPRLPWEDID